MSTRLITDSSEWSFPLLERFERELGQAGP
jgi:hypothetical protein